MRERVTLFCRSLANCWVQKTDAKRLRKSSPTLTCVFLPRHSESLRTTSKAQSARLPVLRGLSRARPWSGARRSEPRPRPWGKEMWTTLPAARKPSSRRTAPAALMSLKWCAPHAQLAGGAARPHLRAGRAPAFRVLPQSHIGRFMPAAALRGGIAPPRCAAPHCRAARWRQLRMLRRFTVAAAPQAGSAIAGP